MGAAFAILSMTLFSAANVAIIRGFDGKTRSGGAFLSIVITFALSLAVWGVMGFANGRSLIDSRAVVWFVIAGILTIFIGRVFLYASIQHLGAVRASAIKRLNPFFSVLLGVALLGEAVNGTLLLGMAFICMSFYVLVRQNLQMTPQRDGEGSAPVGTMNPGYLYGPISAFAYASGYVARKQGLSILPDAAFGTMVGALAGIVVFVAASRFVATCRDDLRGTFTVFNPWLLLAGILSSLGQLCYFVALTDIAISRIALITSMEVFVTILLSTVIFRSKEEVTKDVVVAAGLGVLGTVFVIVG